MGTRRAACAWVPAVAVACAAPSAVRAQATFPAVTLPDAELRSGSGSGERPLGATDASVRPGREEEA
jgi:hypothetical protein